jgi:predicted amidohydrolase
MRAGAVQCSVERGDVAANVLAAQRWVELAGEKGCDLVVLPECALTGYIFDSRDDVAAVSLRLDGPELQAIAQTCRETGVHAVVGMFEQNEGAVHNTAVLIGPDGIIGFHRKNHLPFLGGDRFVDLPVAPQTSVFQTPIGIIGIAICYEIRFPEIMRTLMLSGAEILALPTNWPTASTILADHFTLVRAAENMVYFIAANRCDAEEGTQYLGSSQIVDPLGKVLAHAGEAIGLVTAELDLERARSKKIVFAEGTFELNPISDRKPEAYRV